ncbi:hypothetical protein [Allofranklinella schreckenbergeri]|uniref:hypothetical protein n=1 Tax=Allofranklinella schreckenbergeri TaxID=1076744 RepID=UPI001EEEC468|nr:hypothetical protein [Allofranklinella schreckenbergeri]
MQAASETACGLPGRSLEQAPEKSPTKKAQQPIGSALLKRKQHIQNAAFSHQNL